MTHIVPAARPATGRRPRPDQVARAIATLQGPAIDALAAAARPPATRSAGGKTPTARWPVAQVGLDHEATRAAEIARAIFGCPVTREQVRSESVGDISLDDLDTAQAIGLRVTVVAMYERLPRGCGAGIRVAVLPVLVSWKHLPMADGPGEAVLVATQGDGDAGKAGSGGWARPDGPFRRFVTVTGRRRNLLVDAVTACQQHDVIVASLTNGAAVGPGDGTPCGSAIHLVTAATSDESIEGVVTALTMLDGVERVRLLPRLLDVPGMPPVQ